MATPAMIASTATSSSRVAAVVLRKIFVYLVFIMVILAAILVKLCTAGVGVRCSCIGKPWGGRRGCG